MPVDFGKSYTDPKTQRAMMSFLKKSNQLTGSRRRGRSKPSTQLNRDPRPSSDDAYASPVSRKGGHGAVKGSNWDERLNEKGMKIPHKPEKQKTNYKPKTKGKRKPPVNSGSYNRRFK
jgi:hypothetical protein